MVVDIATESARKSTTSSSRRSVVEVVTRGERRRRRSDEDRARILTEAMAPVAIASHVARRFGVSKVVRTSGSIRKYGFRASAIRTALHFLRRKLYQFQ